MDPKIRRNHVYKLLIVQTKVGWYRSCESDMQLDEWRSFKIPNDSLLKDSNARFTMVNEKSFSSQVRVIYQCL